MGCVSHQLKTAMKRVISAEEKETFVISSVAPVAHPLKQLEAKRKATLHILLPMRFHCRPQLLLKCCDAATHSQLTYSYNGY